MAHMLAYVCACVVCVEVFVTLVGIASPEDMQLTRRLGIREVPQKRLRKDVLGLRTQT